MSTHMPINRKVFFASVRSAPFGGILHQQQVNGMTAILDAWDAGYTTTDRRWLGYCLATTFWETGRTMQPIEEWGKGHGHPYGIPDPVTHQAYYGRGDVQLTWLANYRKAGALVGEDLVNHPELALRQDIASKIMFRGMITGLFTGHKLSDYFNDKGMENPTGARQIINGLDHAADIAHVYHDFMTAITAANAVVS